MRIGYINIFSLLLLLLLSYLSLRLLFGLLLLLGSTQLGNAGLADYTEKFGHLGS
jgi:hypothetical protein